MAAVPYRTTFVRLLGFLRPVQLVPVGLDRARRRLAGRRDRVAWLTGSALEHALDSGDETSSGALVVAVLASGSPGRSSCSADG